MNHTKTLPVRKWLLALDRIHSNDLAAEAWLAVVRAQGWSPVGDPKVINNPQHAEFGVVGRIVEYAGLTIDSDAQAIQVPA